MIDATILCASEFDGLAVDVKKDETEGWSTSMFIMRFRDVS